jgi:exosortase D (VPLPA-CTERM-specific)
VHPPAAETADPLATPRSAVAVESSQLRYILSASRNSLEGAGTALRRVSIPTYILAAFASAGTLVSFGPALSEIYNIWNIQPEYSYGILIPLLSLFLIWRERDQLRGLRLEGSWYGLVMVAFGLGLRLVGEISTMTTIQRYAFLIVLYGLVLALAGPVIFRRIWMALAVLIFMIPLPMFLTDGLSLDLQLLSSAIGVWMIRAVGISVFLQGNVVDLGNYQLEVAEACSGLRYLFPLMTLSFLIAYLFRGAFWKRVVIFLASAPTTVLMNSVRIAVIGVTVDRWGPAMAEGALHEFEGWLVFMLSTAVVLLVAFVLSKVGKTRVPSWRDAFNAPPAPAKAAASTPAESGLQRVPQPLVAATILLAVGVAGDLAIPVRQEILPARATFAEFPTNVGDWSGSREALEPVYADALQLDDYVMADFVDVGGPPINFYVAYYQSQRSGHRVHSPINCIPGGGWTILNLQKRSLPLSGPDGQTAVPVNRAVIELGTQRSLVYYWFQERGRLLTNENVVKWYIFWDALTKNRTDGALVRLVVPIAPGVKEADLDAKLQNFVALVEPRLNNYVPD